MTDATGYRLGLPAWAFPGWFGRYFAADGPRLASYARVFDTVEGNTSFYRIPDAATVTAWRDAVAGRDFRFCFKLPREVTHEPVPDLERLARFVEAIGPLDAHLGPLLVQFPARIGPAEIGTIETVLQALPERLATVVEVRHPAFFDESTLLDPVLERFDAGRVVLDSRPLYAGDPNHPDVAAARHEKPELPVLPGAERGRAFVRLVLHPDASVNDQFLDEWATRFAAYLRQGSEAYMLIHCPNNLHCPPLARAFHESLMAHAGALELPPLPPFPVPQQAPLL